MVVSSTLSPTISVVDGVRFTRPVVGEAPGEPSRWVKHSTTNGVSFVAPSSSLCNLGNRFRRESVLAEMGGDGYGGG